MRQIEALHSRGNRQLKGPAAKRALIEALRSGKYRQIRGRFQDGYGGYCVMGLALHLRLDLELDPGALVWMNDHLCLTFAEIADRIEAGDYAIASEPPFPGEALDAFAAVAVRSPSDGGPP